MKDLEEDYKENKENCEHLVQRRNQLILAAKPLNFMETFRFVVFSDNYDPTLFHIFSTYNINYKNLDHVYYLRVRHPQSSVH